MKMYCSNIFCGMHNEIRLIQYLLNLAQFTGHRVHSLLIDLVWLKLHLNMHSKDAVTGVLNINAAGNFVC